MGVDRWRDVWRIAGALGIDPRFLTLRQLLDMADGHGRDRWARTSLVAAILANANRDPKKQRAYKHLCD